MATEPSRSEVADAVGWGDKEEPTPRLITKKRAAIIPYSASKASDAPTGYDNYLARDRSQGAPETAHKPTPRRKVSSNKPITRDDVERLFRPHIDISPSSAKALPVSGQKDLRARIHAHFEWITEALNRPWVEGYTHGLWELHRAVRIILDDAPMAAEAEEEHPSRLARQREAAYRKLAEGAQALLDAGVRLPFPGDRPPKTKHELSVANSHHRDWAMVFSAVVRVFAEAGKPVDDKKSSPAVKVAADLLQAVGVPASPDAIAKMLKRRLEKDEPVKGQASPSLSHKAPRPQA